MDLAAYRAVDRRALALSRSLAPLDTRFFDQLTLLLPQNKPPVSASETGGGTIVKC
jgi:hypothetical protein